MCIIYLPLYVARRRALRCAVAQQGVLVIPAPLADSTEVNAGVVLGEGS